MTRGRVKRHCQGCLAGLAALLCLAALAPAGQAAPPKFLLQMGSPGDGAGQLFFPRGIAIEPVTSHAYVADTTLERINEFTPWGAFVKAFGWDVAPGAVDEEQEVRIRATDGQFKLTFAAASTADLPFDASAGELEAALNALPTISAGGGSVTVEGAPLDTPGTTPAIYVVRFDGGPLKAANLAQLAVSNGTTPLSGGNPTTLEARTRADGTGGGTGLEACTTASGCQQGVTGGGVGQFRTSGGLAFDPAGNLYTFDSVNRRIQKFDPAGRFLWMVGGEVNKTTGEEICTQADLEASEECQAGISGTGPREFSMSGTGTSGDYLELGTDGNLYAGDKDRIQVIGTDGSFVREIKFADVNAENSAFPASGDPGGLAIDPNSGDLYFNFAQGTGAATKVHNVFKLSPAGALLEVLAVEAPEAVATDSEGNVYAVEVPATGTGGFEPPRVVAFDSTGDSLFDYEGGIGGVAGARLPTLATNSIGNLFVSNTNPVGGVGHVAVYGPPPNALASPPLAAPEIEDQFATFVGNDSAEVRALINPHLWSSTRYYAEYGTEPCATATCTQVPTPPGPLLTEEVVDSSIATEDVVLSGLEEGTTYHFRFLAESNGGGPTVGSEGTFTTRRQAEIQPCPGNEMPRSALSQNLPDCRAYEMVSPIDKNGGDLVPLCQILCYPAALNQSAATKAQLTFSTYNSYGDAESAPYSSQYLASRVAGAGWQNHGITPALDGTLGLDRDYEAFTPELEFGWIYWSKPPAPAAGSEVPNTFRRNNAEGSYEALVPQAVNGDKPELQAVTSDGRCTVFRVKAELTDNAVADLTQTYKSCEGAVTLVSVLPGGAASTDPSSAGTPMGFANGREGSMFNALSEDGERVFWSRFVAGSESLYVRIGDTETKAISGAGSNAFFWGAASSGRRAIYQEGTTLKEAVVDAGGSVATATIATEAIGVAGMSEDASRVYFASRADLDGGGEAEAGEPNLYLLERKSSSLPGSGEASFIAALSELDVGVEVSPVAQRNTRRQARVSADGAHLAFMSRGQLTGYDNTDQDNGEPDAEVFLYDAGEEELICASCNPTGVRPVGREVRFGLEGSIGTGIQAAAKLPQVNSQLYLSRALSEDGSRLFFESYDRLAPADESDSLDVYQWEELGAGPAEDKCEEQDASFDPNSGGCIDLISPGTSELDAEFLDATADGSDVFFSTGASLVEWDPSQVDIYDARVGGGLPEPLLSETRKPQCDPESDCQPAAAGPPPPPALQSQSSGPGNPTFNPPKPPQRCRKGTHRVKRNGKVRCVKNKGGKAKKRNRQNKSRRAVR